MKENVGLKIRSEDKNMITIYHEGAHLVVYFSLRVTN